MLCMYIERAKRYNGTIQSTMQVALVEEAVNCRRHAATSHDDLNN